MVEGIIFDADGTILDSMDIWMDAGKIYLETFGIVAEENLGDILFEMTMNEGAEYIKEKCNLDFNIEEIIKGVNDVVYNFYKNDVIPKEGVLEFIKYVYSENIPMTVATSTDRKMIEAAFKRLGIDKYFKQIFTTTEIGVGKGQPDIYLKAKDCINSRIENTWLIDDAVYALKAALNSGFMTVGVYDSASKDVQDKVKEVSKLYLKDWKDYKTLIKEMNM